MEMENITSSAAVPEMPKKRGMMLKVAGVALVVLVGVGLYFFTHRTAATGQGQISQEQASQIVAAVSKLIMLPQGETPTIATVSDPSKLKDQPFFANAKQGDMVLIYAGTKKVIIYSPDTNKIVDVGAVNITPTK